MPFTLVSLCVLVRVELLPLAALGGRGLAFSPLTANEVGAKGPDLTPGVADERGWAQSQEPCGLFQLVLVSSLCLAQAVEALFSASF